MNCNCKEVAEKGRQKVEESLAMQLVRSYGKQAKKWFIAWLITFIALVGIVSGVVYYFTTTEFSVVEQSIDGNGTANFTGRDGDIYNGQAESNSN